MDLASDLLQCNDISPDFQHRCGLDLDHVGAHENWYGSWWKGVWLTKFAAVLLALVALVAPARANAAPPMCRVPQYQHELPCVGFNSEIPPGYSLDDPDTWMPPGYRTGSPGADGW